MCHSIWLSLCSWFHYCSRDEAEVLLDKDVEGQFLVRPSQSSDSVYGISVRYLYFLSVPFFNI